MPVRRAITWSELRVGIVVLAALGILATFIFYVTGEGALLARQVTLKTYLPDVAGLKAGAPVRLAGVEIGAVRRVGLSEFVEEPARHTEVIFRVREPFQKEIRTDSEAFITTEGLLGESVLEITRGVAGEPLAMEGEEGIVLGTQRGNIKQIIQNVDHITGDIRTLTTDLRNAKGTLGRLIEDPSLYNRARQAVDEFRSLTERAAAGEGTLGKLAVSEELYDQLKGTADTMDQFARDLRSGGGTISKLVYETELYDKANQMVERADNIVARVEAGEGTLGKLISDDTLHNDVQQTFANAREITRKLNEGEGTFGRAVNDPRLYENINEFLSETRALISDFRKNPKKYLRIKLSLF